VSGKVVQNPAYAALAGDVHLIVRTAPESASNGLFIESQFNTGNPATAPAIQATQ